MSTLPAESKCPAVDDTGLSCQKRLYLAQNGEYWDHAGGHIYARPETMEALGTMHYDAGAFLAGEQVVMHKPEDCTYTGFCSWRKYNIV
jgi:hypothetical protein